MNIWEASQKLVESNTSFVTVTMIAIRGSAPQDLGAKILVTETGLYFGTIGGGRVEQAAIKRAKEILISGEAEPQLINWNLQRDIGMSCGGEVTFLFEHHNLCTWPIVIFGAGHVSQALTRVLSKLQCSVTCIDPREEWISKLEGVRGVVHPEPKELVPGMNRKSFFLSMTMGHAFDVPILYEIWKHFPDCPYVGVIGSDVKAVRIKKDLKDLGVSDAFLKKLRVPMGLPIGTNQPNEIAISISAELLQVRDSTSGESVQHE